jgi:hypothetical protein
MIRDWTISNWTDDFVPTAPQYQQPTWNLRKVMGIYLPSTTALTASVGAANAASPQIALRALASAFVRFAVPGNEAYVWASANGRPLAAGVRLAVVRTK